VPKYIFQQQKLPAFNSRFGKKFARDLWNYRLYCGDARRTREKFVRECDEAYLCHRWTPDVGMADLIENGEFGESDIHDNANAVSIRLALSLMPRNDPWLQVMANDENEDPKLTEAMTDWQKFLHHKARTRRNMQRVIKQGYVRGTTWLYYDWEQTHRLRELTEPEHRVAIKSFLEEQGLPTSHAKKFARGRVKECTFNGPIITPVDFFDVWTEPFQDIVNNRRPTTIMQRFRNLAQLKSEVDEFDKPVYQNLDEIEPFPIEEIYHNNDLAGGRTASQRIFGGPASVRTSGVKLVPVYIFYLPYYKTDDGYEFWDTYVHLALSSKGFTPHIIKIEQNSTGLNHLLGDHYVDWFTPTPYGISGVEFSISKYHQKNFLQLLTITGAAHSVMKPKMVYEPAFRDPEELDFGAGGVIPVQENPLGMDVIRDVPGYEQGTLLGQQVLRFYAEELRAASGVDGMVPNNQARSINSRKTATEVNADLTSGSFFLDNQAENLNEMLEELCMGVYELSIQNIIPSDNNPNQIEFEKYLGDRAMKATLSISDVQVKRSIQVRGVHGQLNKQQDIQNMLMMFQTASQIQDPWAGPVKLFLAQRLARKLGIPIPAELEMAPEQVVATNPQIQMAAIQQGLQNPEVMQAVAQQFAQPQVPPNGAEIQQAERIDSHATGGAGAPPS
jgi:hypothetical protein